MVDSGPHPSFKRQALACFAIYCLSMSMGSGTGFSGVAIDRVASNETGFGMDSEQISWFASLPSFAMIPTCLIGGVLGEWLGRKMSCLLIGPLYIIGHLCLTFAPDIQMLFFGRVIFGVAAGLSCSPAGVYVSEISTPTWRTTFGAGLSAFFMVGTFITYTLGKWLDWRTLSGICCVYPTLSILLCSIVPESPAYLANNGRFYEARRSLQWLRGPTYDVDQEYTDLLKSVNKHKMKTDDVGEKSRIKQILRNTLDFFVKLTRPDVWKPLSIVTSVMFLQQFTGIATISFYAVSMMEKAGSSIDKYTATIIFGLVRLASCFIGSYFIKRFKRRPLFVVSSLCVSAGMCLLGVSVYLREVGGMDSFAIGLLPLISVNIIAISYQAGLGPIPWSYISELYPVDVRGSLSGLSNCIAQIYIFLTLKTFPAVQASFTIYGGYWLYAGFGLLAAIFGAAILPDTKGKTLTEVSEYFTSGCCVLRPKKDKEEDSKTKMPPIASSEELEDLV